MKYKVLFIFFLISSSCISQDVINDYISKVYIYFDDINYELSTSDCNWSTSGEGNGEFRLRVDIWDGSAGFHSSTNEELGWYITNCFTKSDGDGIFSEWVDYDIYEITNNSYNSRTLTLDSRLKQWEEDPTPNSCRAESGDDCLTEITNPNSVDISSSGFSKYGSTQYDFWHPFYSLGGSYNIFDINYQFEIRPTLGTSFNSSFNFATIDVSSACFSQKKHPLNTSNRTSNFIYYKFTLDNYNSIEIDWTDQPQTNIFSSVDLYVFNSSTFNYDLVSFDENTTTTKGYYNLTPDNYYVKMTRVAHGKYIFKINSLTVTSPSTVVHYWNGSEGNNWFNPCNWSTGHVPDKNNDVIVSSVTNLPRIYSSGNATPGNANGYPNGQAYCNSLEILLGGKITIEGPLYGTANLNVNHP